MPQHFMPAKINALKVVGQSVPLEILKVSKFLLI